MENHFRDLACIFFLFLACMGADAGELAPEGRQYTYRKFGNALTACMNTLIVCNGGDTCMEQLLGHPYQGKENPDKKAFCDVLDTFIGCMRKSATCPDEKYINYVEEETMLLCRAAAFQVQAFPLLTALMACVTSLWLVVKDSPGSIL